MQGSDTHTHKISVVDRTDSRELLGAAFVAEHERVASQNIYVIVDLNQRIRLGSIEAIQICRIRP